MAGVACRAVRGSGSSLGVMILMRTPRKLREKAGINATARFSSGPGRRSSDVRYRRVRRSGRHPRFSPFLAGMAGALGSVVVLATGAIRGRARRRAEAGRSRDGRR
mgnify:FL=1